MKTIDTTEEIYECDQCDFKADAPGEIADHQVFTHAVLVFDDEQKEARPELHIAEIGEARFLADSLGPWCESAQFAIVTADSRIRVFRLQHAPAPSVKPTRIFAHYDPLVPDECVVHWTDGGNHIISQTPNFAGFARLIQIDGKEVK